MSLLLGVIASLLGKNVFFEISRPNIIYIQNLIDTVYQWKYTILFIYPFTKNYKVLCDRSYKRGIIEGRIVPCEQIKQNISDCNDEYTQRIKKVLFNKYKDICILKYNAELPPEELTNIDNSNFNVKGNIYVYEFLRKNKGKIYFH
jgi:hypothetical protein